MYMIVSKGTQTIKASVQIRDDNFRLLANCPAGMLKKNLEKLNTKPSGIEKLLEKTKQCREGEIIKI